ncbi:hypothetical protein [Fibrobacter succinogenes]|uniref:hypothetical protein n=1 Tax=Fibrobacter succinogenes TaxID=833 RepID=UPI0013D2A38A|nr:hypothetical protein [Fibrobacter succinogenes]
MTNYEIEMELDKASKALSKETQSINLSYWNAGSEYKAQLKDILKYESVQDIFDYQYYLPESIKKNIATKLGFSSEDFYESQGFAFSQSTHSIVTIAVFLSQRNLKTGIIAPAYFTAQTCLDDLKVDYHVFNEFIPNFNQNFDIGPLINSDCEAFWFTSPINSTSVYFNQNVVNGIQELLDAGKWVILDEALCVNGKELSRTLGIQEKLMYIYSPHKALGIQGIKFSVIVTHKKFSDEIDRLKDCYGGSLNYLSQLGARHFISQNYDECLRFYNQFWSDNYKRVHQILANYHFAHVSPDISGHYAMIFLDGCIGTENFIFAIKKLIQEKGYLIFPGVMHGFDISKQFCFRINLLLNKSDLEKGLISVLDYMGKFIENA